MEDGEVFDFRGMRLDWFRLQVSHAQLEPRPPGGKGPPGVGKMVVVVVSSFPRLP